MCDAFLKKIKMYDPASKFQVLEIYGKPSMTKVG